MTSIKRPSAGPAPVTAPSAGPAAKVSTPPPAAAPSKGWGPKPGAAPKQESGLSGFFHGLENKAKDLLMKSMGPYPSAGDRAARTAQLDQAVAKMGLPPDQQKLLSTLKQAGANSVDLWQGSHMKFDDGGKLYDQLKSMPGAEARASSHYPDVKTQQYQLMVGNAPLLFGKDAKGNTWMQMEGHPFHQKFDLDPKKLAAQLGDDAAHLTDYAKYVALGKTQNIGPMGISPHSEHHDPLQVHYTGG
ncbi:MAG: hypothetical protein QM723_36865 [Myxococcaceae bacterium]